ncbi:LRR receptor-like kinase [Medicago truncatula]|uniref:LRR receptor-like kinase n=2 Tax=Medicago truncatula TaxID=3880 RepID=A0A072TUC8_MEDTR|nr:LRR receptor-like kinase [Medicago truncatula]
MKNLQELDLSRNRMSGDFPHCLSNLTNLQVLDLSSNNFVGNIPSFITSLKSLEYLSLFDTNFDGIFSFSSLTNHSKLEVFLLSRMKNNKLHVETEENPSWHPTFQLRVLQLKNCFLNSRRNGTFPTFLLNQHELQLLDLSHNKLSGNFPSWLIENNTKLETLYLMNNSFTGTLELPTFKHGLLDLQISNNKIGSQLQENIGKIFPILNYVNLSKNSFEGILPSSIGEMQTIKTLDLSNNNFSGEFSSHLISNLTSLRLLKLSHNSFHGPVPLLSKLARLRWLYLNNNSFSGEIEDGVSNKSSLNSLDISNNMISGRIPRWIGSFTKLSVLSLSKNQLQGDIPNELCNLFSLNYLDLSENNLSGILPYCFNNFKYMKFLYLQKNSLQGNIPHALSQLTQLTSLDLRDNNFFGNIPQWINRLSMLRVLLLAGNKLTGPIPIYVCELEHVKIMDLSHNWISETIPSCINNISFRMVEYESTAIGSASVEYDDDSKDKIQYYENTAVAFIFRMDEIWFVPGNTFHILYNSSLSLNHPSVDTYMISYETIEVEFRTKSYYLSYKGNNLNLMTGLDLSSNYLSGSIPPEIGELREIIALNLSRNRLSGSIPGTFSNLINIESLDLSYNNLSGAIPQNLTDLYSLAIFNVSYNKFSGTIPTTMQFANFDENNYRGNSDLCGSVINIICNHTSIFPPASTTQHQTAIDIESFYWSCAASYVSVIIGLAVILWVNSHWCRAWFHYVDLCIFYCFTRCFKNVFH